jgi:hypothetical protein
MKQVFPPRLFALFVDVGNYTSDLEKYTPLLQEFLKMQVNISLLLINPSNLTLRLSKMPLKSVQTGTLPVKILTSLEKLDPILLYNNWYGLFFLVNWSGKRSFWSCLPSQEGR